MDSYRGGQSPASSMDDEIIDNNENVILASLSEPGSKTGEGSGTSARKSKTGKSQRGKSKESDSDSDNDIMNLTKAEKRDLLAGIKLLPDICKLLSAQKGKDSAPVDPIVPAMVQAINMSYTKDDCLELLSKIFDCVTVTDKCDRSGAKSKKFMVEFDLAIEGTWLQEPVPNSRVKVGSSFESVGLFPATLKRPIANRYLTPKGIDSNESTIKEEVVSNEFMTSLPLKCRSDPLKSFFKEGPLVRSDGGTKKAFDVPFELFNVKKVEWPGSYPIFSNIDCHARNSLQGCAAVSQLVSALRDRNQGFLENWDQTVKFSDGEFVNSDSKLLDNFTNDQMHFELWMARATSELVLFELENIMDLLKATITACRHEGRKLVLEASNKKSGDPIYEELLNSAYNSPTLFGPVSDSLMSKVANEGPSSMHCIHVGKKLNNVVKKSEFNNFDKWSIKGKRSSNYPGPSTSKKRKISNSPFQASSSNNSFESYPPPRGNRGGKSRKGGPSKNYRGRGKRGKY